MSCQFNHIPGLLKISCCSSETDCECYCGDKDNHSPPPEQNDTSKNVPDKVFPVRGHQTTTLKEENDGCTNAHHNLEEMYGILNTDSFISETTTITDSKLSHTTTPPELTRSCSDESLRDTDSAGRSELLEVLTKTCLSEVSSTSIRRTEKENQNSNVLMNESSPDCAESFTKSLVVDKQSTRLDSSSHSPALSGVVSQETCETLVQDEPIPFRTPVEDMKVPWRDSNQPEYQIERKKVKKRHSRLPSSAMPKERSCSFGNPTKQFSSQYIPTNKRNVPHAAQKHPLPLQQSKSHRDLVEPPFYNGTEKPDPQPSSIRSSAWGHPFGTCLSQGTNNTARHTNILTTKLHALNENHYNESYHRAEYPRVSIPEAKRFVQKTSYFPHSSYNNSASIQYPKPGTPENIRFHFPRALESYSSGASYFNRNWHGTNHPRGRASEIPRYNTPSSLYVTRLENLHTRYAGARRLQNPLFPSRSYASVVASNVTSNAPNPGGRILESKFYYLDPSWISLLPEETFEKICHERIICENSGYYYIIFKVNNANKQKREFHIRYITSQNLDGTCNFSPQDNGVPTRGVRCDNSLRSPLHIIQEWLRSLPSPEEMDRIR